MGILNALFKTPREGFSGDLFSQKPIEIFLNAREHLTYFNSLRGVDAERNFHQALRSAIEPLLQFVASSEHIELIDTIIFKNKAGQSGRQKQNSDISSYLKRIDSEGFELMELGNDITFDSLKRSYRAAVKKHHPDVGGDVENMKIINGAFNKFHDALCSGDTRSFSGETSAPGFLVPDGRECSCGRDVIYLSLVALAESLIDVWAVDEAIVILKKLDGLGDLQQFQELSYFTSYSFANSLLKGSERLHHISKTEDAEWLLAHFETVFKSAERFDPLIFDRLKGCKKNLKVTSDLKIVIRHKLQAENLYRLKAIDEKRFKAHQKKSGDAEKRSEVAHQQMAEVIKRGFLTLSFDSKFRTEIKTEPLIPVPRWEQYRINHLNDEQRSEYLYAFAGQNNVELVTKYMPIRLSSYLLSLVYNFSREELVKIKSELEVFGKLGLIHNSTLIEFEKILRHLESLSDSELKTKLAYCQKVDDPSERSTSIVITISLFDRQPQKHPVDVSSSYVHFLESIDSNGNDVPMDESSWNRDLAALNKLNNGAVYKSAQDACWNDGKPEKIVEAVDSYINALCALGNKMDPLNVGQLQLGYWVDRLTTAYGKLKKWDLVSEKLDWFFSLDKAYFERLSNGDRDKMIKRLERARKEIRKAS